MASFQCVGFIDAIRLTENGCLLFLSEFKKGYRKSDGERVEDRYISWVVIFKSYFKKYLLDHFAKGMLVEVKGEVYPFAIEHGKTVEGVSCIGQTCNLFSFPRSSVKQEMRMIRDGEREDEKPNLEEFESPDF